MTSAIVKRSIVLGGHKTSVSLEKEFWEGLRHIADRQDTKMSALLRKIDTERQQANMSSAIRVFVLQHYRALIAGEPPSIEGPRAPTPWATESAAVG